MALRGDRLRAAREARGYTQDTLAKLLRVETQQIIRWESAPSDPACSFILRLAQTLDVSTDFLLGNCDQFQIVRELDLSPTEQRIIMAHRAGKLLDMLRPHIMAAKTTVVLPDASDPLVKQQNEARRRQIKRFRKEKSDED